MKEPQNRLRISDKKELLRMFNLSRRTVFSIVTTALVGLSMLALAACGSTTPSTAATTGPATTAPVTTAPVTDIHHSTNSSQFQTLNDKADVTFNQLLGINNNGVIAGYFGSGASGHPNKGYTLRPSYGQGNYTNENFP